MGPRSNPLAALIASQAGRKRFALVAVLVILPVATAIGLQATANRGQLPFDFNSGLSAGDPFSTSTSPNAYYADERGDGFAVTPLPYIPSRVVEGPYLQVFVPYVLSLFRERAEKKRIRLHVLIAANVVPVLADRRALEQGITNLVDNAVKSRPAGSGVSVRAELTGDSAPPAVGVRQRWEIDLLYAAVPGCDGGARMRDSRHAGARLPRLPGHQQRRHRLPGRCVPGFD